MATVLPGRWACAGGRMALGSASAHFASSVAGRDPTLVAGRPTRWRGHPSCTQGRNGPVAVARATINLVMAQQASAIDERGAPVNPGSIANRFAAVATAFAAVAAIGGLLIPGLYRDAPYWVQQARGTDLATLFVAVPVLTLGLWTARGGSPAGRLAIFAGLLYLVYNYGIFVFSVVMNPLTGLHIVIVGFALWSLILATRSAALGEAGAAVAPGLDRRASGVLLIGVAALFGLLWIGQIATATATGTVAPDLVRAGLSTNPVYALDLAFFLPLCALAGIGLLRRNAAGTLGLPMLIWVALMGAGVLGGFLFSAAAGEVIPIVVAVTIGALSLVSAALAGVPLARYASRPRTVSEPLATN